MKIENYKKFKYFYFNRDCKLNLNAINKKKITFILKLNL